VIELSNGRYVRILEVKPIHFALRSAEEQANIIQSFASLLKIAPVRIQIKSVSRRANGSEYIQSVQSDLESQTDTESIALGQEYVRLIQSLESRDAVSRRFFVIFEYEPIARQETSYASAYAALETATHTLKSCLAQCGNAVVIPTDADKQLAEILYAYLNPKSSRTEPLKQRVERVVVDTMITQGKTIGKDPIPEIPFAHFVAPRGLDLAHRQYVIVDGTYMCFLYIRKDGYPNRVRGGWLSTLINAGEGIDVDLFLQRELRSRVLDKVAQRIRLNRTKMKSIQDTMKITNAMYMISSTKLRKAKKNLEETEPYFYTLQTMVSRIVRHLPEIDNKYFDERKDKPAEEKTTGLVVVTADKGLAGAYNHNVLKMAEEQMQKAGQTGKYKLFVVGELGRQYFGHRGIEVAEQFHYTAQNPTLHRARIITETILEQFQAEQLDEVYIIYTNMVNSVTTEPQMMRLLPIIKERFITKDGQDLSMYQEPLVMTPSPKAVLDNIVPDFVMGYVYGALVESFCSEQNARMMAMEAANKNASAMIHDLSIQYNRVRQAMITQEITEVIAGAKAQKKKKKARKEVLSN